MYEVPVTFDSLQQQTDVYEALRLHLGDIDGPTDEAHEALSLIVTHIRSIRLKHADSRDVVFVFPSESVFDAGVNALKQASDSSLKWFGRKLESPSDQTRASPRTVTLRRSSLGPSGA